VLVRGSEERKGEQKKRESFLILDLEGRKPVIHIN
jgi:hypothetical protein